MRRALAAAALLALCGCSRTELDHWLAWWQQDPATAEQFAEQPAVQADLATREHERHPDLSSDGPQFQTWSRWDQIAQCESGGRWHFPPVTNRTGTYSGGLMIWTRAWTAYGGQQFAPQAWQATKAEQIAVAERILADRGWSAWDCA